MADRSKPSRRIQRIASRMKLLVSQVILNELNDPRVGFVTVLEVEPTEDMREAKVYLSFLGGEVRWATNELHGINTAHGLAPDATTGHPYQEIEDLWKEIGVDVDE